MMLFFTCMHFHDWGREMLVLEGEGPTVDILTNQGFISLTSNAHLLSFHREHDEPRMSKWPGYKCTVCGLPLPTCGPLFPIVWVLSHTLFENDANSDSRAKDGKQKQCWPTMWSCWSSLWSIWEPLQKDQMFPKMWLYSCAFLEVSMHPLHGFCPMDISSIDHRINEGKSLTPWVWFLKVSG